jgi:hypothetical protein
VSYVVEFLLSGDRVRPEPDPEPEPGDGDGEETPGNETTDGDGAARVAGPVAD